jgi:uncharacterized protein YdeI (YjbR/CyaY-like superfamily)
MAEVGIKYYLEGLQRPVHDYGVAKNPEMPRELKAALGKNKKAQANFLKFPPSARRTFLRWIEMAKRAETRKKRIAEVVKRASANRKAY